MHHKLIQNSRRATLLALAAMSCTQAFAETRDVSAGGFEIQVRRELTASRAQVYRSLGQISQWWNSAHTWSGKAANLSLPLEASACLCERWNGGSVEHGRVIHAAQDSLLRLNAALGPLQAMPVTAVLSFALTESAGKTVLQTTYRVAGAGQNLQPLAQPVDGVITEQVDRLVRFIATGKPDPQ